MTNVIECLVEMEKEIHAEKDMKVTAE